MFEFNCCERMKKFHSSGWIRLDKDYNYEISIWDDEGVIVDDIKFCPFCGTKIGKNV
jgi:hypothetical protein